MGEQPEAVARESEAGLATALETIKAGLAVMVLGPDSHPGFLVAAAGKATPELVETLSALTVGHLAAVLPDTRVETVLPGRSTGRPTPSGTVIHFALDTRDVMDGGGSAGDIAATARSLANPVATGKDFLVPGHLLVVGAANEGVLDVFGPAECALDLVRLAGEESAALTCRIRPSDLAGIGATGLAEALGVAAVSREAILQARLDRHDVLDRLAAISLPTAHDDFTCVAFSDRLGGEPTLALIRGSIPAGRPPRVHVQCRCLAGEVLRATDCSCGETLDQALQPGGADVVIYDNERDPERLVRSCADGGGRRAPEDFDVKQLRWSIVGQVLAAFSVGTCELTSNAVELRTHWPRQLGGDRSDFLRDSR